MPYNLIDNSLNEYKVLKGEPFTSYDAGEVFLSILNNTYPNLLHSSEIVSERKGIGNRKEVLFKIAFTTNPTSTFFVYCFQTESGGRWNSITNGEDEARIQWRKHSDWIPDLNTIQSAKVFQDEIAKQPNDLSNKECYIFSFYKRDLGDSDIIISSLYPTQARDVETNSGSSKSIQISYAKIREAFINGYSQQFKSNDEYIFHFKPKYLISYMINRDQLHKQALESVLKPNGNMVKPLDFASNLIYFGAPGTGKSNSIDSYTNDDNSIKITFHPDTDYSSFVGSYKPVKDEVQNCITYDFVPQSFLQAYLKAWETDENTFLIIEELNRGNCAQIFGDIFQLIERDENGYSKYKIDIDSEIEKFLKRHFEELLKTDASKTTRYIDYFGGNYNKISLPSNLFIHATMNTSDQSLFPMDSAFKRRWDWEYIPIDFEGTEAAEYVIKIGTEDYSWKDFVETINEHIETITESADKKIGPFFIKSFDSEISEKSFKSKIMFYLWNDILKDESQTNSHYFFKCKEKIGDDLESSFIFNNLFEKGGTDLLKQFMNYLNLKNI